VRVIVAGGGIGGLSATIALRRAGIEADVFEQREDVRTTMVGGGFHLWPNAIRALGELGLAEVARARGALLERTELHSWRRGELAVWPLSEIASDVGGFDVGTSRADLQRLLYEAVEPAAINSGAQLLDFEEDRHGVTVRFADGREERCDALVGADGLRSAVRAQLMGAIEPDYAGYVQWQTVVDDEGEGLPPASERIVFGPGMRTVAHRVGGGGLFWACVVYCPETEAGTPAGRKAVLLQRFGDWPEPIPRAVEATPEEQIAGLPVYDRKPVQQWGKGRVTLLGDAAHPMTTNTSQGGNQAIEDAVVLARCVSGASDVAGALRAYEERRITRTTPLVKNSHWIAGLGAWSDPLRVGFRDRFFAMALERKGLKDLRTAVGKEL
jgi:2-polyprenyl-6-methoxyphenol hydroxylase-like FAD-dependent oxidoreductase